MNNTHKYIWIGLILAICLITGIALEFQNLNNKSKEPIQSSGILDTAIPGGVTARNVAIEDVISMFHTQTGLQFVLGEGVGNIISTFNFNGEPTVKEMIDTVLPELGLAYKVLENDVIYIDQIEKISAVQPWMSSDSIVPATSLLNTVIPGVVTSPNVPIEDLIFMLQAQAGLQFVLGEGIGRRQCSFFLSGDSTVKEIFDAVFPSLDLAYKELDSGVVHIDLPEKIASTQSLPINTSAIPASSLLHKIIPGDITAPNVPLEDVIAMIQAQTGIQFILGESIGTKSVAFNIQNDP